MDKYKQYIDMQWWNNITKRNLENWLKNFEDHIEVAQLILDNVIFYNKLQLKAYTRFIVNHLKEQVYMQTISNKQFSYVTDEILQNQWNKYLAVTNIVPAALKSDPASSAHTIIGYWRSILEKNSDILSVISDIGEKYKNGIRRFVLVDDFSGSGNQMSKVLEQKIVFNQNEVRLAELPAIDKKIEIIVAVYVIHEKAKKMLEQKYPMIKIEYVDLLDDNLNYLNGNATIYEKYSYDERKKIISEIKKLSEQLLKNNVELKELSSYILNIPIVFEHGCPNNTLLLLFAHSDKWQQLFKRGNEI